MKAVVLSAALVGAIPALAAAPPAYANTRPYGGRPWPVSSSSSCTESTSSSVSAAPYGYGHGNSTRSWGATGTGYYSKSTPVAPVSYSASSSPAAPVWYSSSAPADVTVTKYETVYASVCSAETTPASYQTGAVTHTYTYTYTEGGLTKTITKTEIGTAQPTGYAAGSTPDASAGGYAKGPGSAPVYGGDSTPVAPAGESATWTGSAPVYGSITLTYSTVQGAPTAPSYGSGPVSSYPIPSGYPSGSGYLPGSGYPAPTGYVPYPGGNGTHAGPTGTGVHGNGTSTSTTTSQCSKPTETETENCIPCEGQNGTPENYCGLDIHTDYNVEMPKTCRTVEYYLEVTNVTFSPDGFAREGLLINGTMPGPLIEANWGDTIVVHLTNKMQNNGTSLHFHGMRQWYTNEMDGVPSITQCPLAPGQSMTYKFKASNYGSSWYHSHFGLQLYNGVFGPMIIHGPQSAEYDVDVGAVMVQDWSHIPVDQLYDVAQTVGPFPQNGPRTLDTGLINGMNVFNTGDSETGKRFELNVEAGKKYLLRLVSTAIQTTFKFHIDGHSFTVISTDFVPVQPYKTDILNINIGQRYNIIVEADQEPGDYWLRSDAQQACSTLTNSRDIRGIVHYEGHSGTPTSTSKTYVDECVDEPYASIIPVLPLNVGAVDDSITENVLIGPGPKTPNLYKWTLNGTTFQSEWGNPTLESIYESGTVPDYSGNLAIEIPNLGEWVYVIIESPIPAPHPIHLHGHDFFVLAQGLGPYIAQPLNLQNPPRRDVAMLPGGANELGIPSGGYVVLAFETDNPGAWLMHCHIGWHASMGFALQIIENLEGIKETVTDSCQLEGTCAAWRTYAQAKDVVIESSGI